MDRSNDSLLQLTSHALSEKPRMSRDLKKIQLSKKKNFIDPILGKFISSPF